MTLFNKSKKSKHNGEGMADGFRRAMFGNEFEDFVRYLRSPWRIMWANFLGGIFRGLGFVIGMTVVLAVVIWILVQVVGPVVSGFFPVFEGYFDTFIDQLQHFSPQPQNTLLAP